MTDTLVSALLRAAETDLPDAGLRFLDRRERPTWIPHAEVLRRALAVAGGLTEAGVAPGDRVAIVLPTAPSFTDSYFACQLMGAVPVPLYPPVRLGRLDEYFARTSAMLEAVGATVLVTDSRVRKLLGRLVSQRPVRLLDAATLLTAKPISPRNPSPDALAMVQFSSGTTVSPKAVGLTHAQVLGNALPIVDRILASNPRGSEYSPAGVSWLPLYHDMGLIGCIFPSLLTPGPLTLIPPELFLAKPAVWLRALSTYKGTISPAPNFAYALCTERIRDEEIEGINLSSWHMALNGAEPISADTLRAFQSRFAAYGLRPEASMPVYGLSEAALAVTFSKTDAPFRSQIFDATALASGRAEGAAHGVELVSSGFPLVGFEVRIVDHEGAALPEGRIGHIEATGPSVMEGYLDREEQPFTADGWLKTGDLGFLDTGELFVTGRAKDLIVVRGRNHAPHDLERAADAVEGVRTGCSAAVAELGSHGERVLLFAEVREPQPGQAEAIERAVQSGTGLRPDLVVLLKPGTLPRTSSGKIRRAETLRSWLAGTLTPPDAVTPVTMAGALASSALGFLKARWRHHSS